MNGIRRHVASTTTLDRSAAVPFVIPSTSTCLRHVEGEMNDIHGIVARTTKFKESATLPFVIPSEAEESAVSPSQYRMLTEKSFCSSGAP
jgi:hypothetical protein